ncbi:MULTISPECIES: glutamine synthetase family protein [Marivita]|uniref:Glutamine synthetase n=1 Tax=Marivita cryptomonadis TaxID=505252 RepID=A0A9Q2PEE4_9RHOB|nr:MULTISPECIES: glutamine synthetase family protein [Marivita]MCR9170015.1 glutamine synthetase family protein [Paracoccaceae bacterium]MBM2323336.1 glutamine synthetase [Marivita cryptomonadis]MBM2332922.1 glutamine synthetase [Marivita cryptomonadis]MBM2342503.1 glutamine synthetase [Marivita cryptomonadis]MBM2347170.1 glutamine synthetase [Marivita cryptomonadis]
MAHMTLDDLQAKAETGAIDTVLVCMVDMQGRLMGKRFHVSNFIESAWKETHCCNYLLATDLEMATPDGYKSTSWEAGYGDYVMKPDLTTLRVMPWLEGTAMVLCDLIDHNTHEPVPHSPRQMLKKQVARLDAMGLTPMMATELEFFLFEHSYDEIRKSGFRNLTPISGYNEDYNILQTTREEHVMRPIRNHLVAAGVPVENSKGEAETGQEELNIRYADALACADNHTIAKHAVKEISQMHGHAASFLPKWHAAKVGSAAHVHQSLFKGDTNVFHDADAKLTMSDTMKSYVAGLIKYAPDMTVFLAPYVNSYKRFLPGTFAPTKIAWSVDNRTAGYRLVGDGTKGVRIECRIPGSDINPYLACAAQLAAGIAGMEEKLSLEEPVSGDVYNMTSIPEIPNTLRAATETLRSSDMLRKAMGDDVIDHYTRAAEVEQEAFDAVVTDWELQRGFERA